MKRKGMRMRLLILGPPGGGKGTQAKKITESLQIPHISTGNLFREAVANQTELGLKANAYMKKGELVPDDIVSGMVEERLRQIECSIGFLLDGFPRTLIQAEALNGILSKLGTKLDAVVNISLSESEVINRLVNRRTCRSCGAIYHLIYNPPHVEGKCDRCGGQLFKREDDREETIRERLRVYRLQTQPLVDYYKARNILVDVNGDSTVDDVFNQIISELKK